MHKRREWSSPSKTRNRFLLQEAPVLLEVREGHAERRRVNHDDTFWQTTITQTPEELIYPITISVEGYPPWIYPKEMGIKPHLRSPRNLGQAEGADQSKASLTYPGGASSRSPFVWVGRGMTSLNLLRLRQGVGEPFLPTGG